MTSEGVVRRCDEKPTIFNPTKRKGWNESRVLSSRTFSKLSIFGFQILRKSCIEHVDTMVICMAVVVVVVVVHLVNKL